MKTFAAPTPSRYHVTVGVVLLLAASVLGTGAATAAPSASKSSTQVTGRLSKPGYTVIAVGYNGRAVTSKAQSFRIRAPHARLTLHLLDARGRYAGPVVVAKSRRGVLTGVRKGTNLGLIKVRAGYATTARALPARRVDSRRVSASVRGVPLGNGRNFGLVKSTRRGGTGAGLDADLDGVPNVFDVDVDGDRVLNALEPRRSARPQPIVARRAIAGQFARAEVAPPPPPGPGPVGPVAPHWMSQIFLTLEDSLNANAASVTREQLDAMLLDNLNMKLLHVPQGDVVELVCAGLDYCSPGGTGQSGDLGADSPKQPFPACCAGSSGYGLLRGGGPSPLISGPEGTFQEFSLWPRATSTKVGTGDAMMLRVTQGPTITETPLPVQFVFVTVPAVASYADTAGLAGTISYPVASGAPGTERNPLEVAAGADGRVVLTMTMWRPQRLGVPGAGEPAFMDIGNLGYTVGAAPHGPNAGPFDPMCSADSLSTSSPALTATPEHVGTGPALGRLIDTSPDRAADASKTFSLTVDLTKCLQDKGRDFAVGTTLGVEVEARAQGSADHANQRLWVRRTA